MVLEEDKDRCEVCTVEPATTIPFGGFDGIHQNCPRCGEFKISGSALSFMSKGLGQELRAILSGWVRNQNTLGSVPLITSDNLNKILATPIPPVMERVKLLLVEAEKGLKRLGDNFDINEPRFLAASYSSSIQDVAYLFRILFDQRLAKSTALGGMCEILPDGYIKLDELRGNNSASANGFVAMHFSPELDEIYYKGFQMGIMDAGYVPLRMDKVEHINRIDDEIIMRINSSKFVVADFTGHRGGVYFEAGYALGIGLPVFWTCKRSDMSELHFDIRQFNCIDWEAPKELADRLQVRLEAVLGKGQKSQNAQQANSAGYDLRGI